MVYDCRDGTGPYISSPTQSSPSAPSFSSSSSSPKHVHLSPPPSGRTRRTREMAPSSSSGRKAWATSGGSSGAPASPTPSLTCSSSPSIKAGPSLYNVSEATSPPPPSRTTSNESSSRRPLHLGTVTPVQGPQWTSMRPRFKRSVKLMRCVPGSGAAPRGTASASPSPSCSSSFSCTHVPNHFAHWCLRPCGGNSSAGKITSNAPAISSQVSLPVLGIDSKPR
mmetsp:Transcript_5537/g.16445  ORF Transcript_5537/g.16445 Transcript_5537/m.16445 type:complete len:223 (+) Transcript_5537:64-732(+)